MDNEITVYFNGMNFEQSVDAYIEKRLQDIDEELEKIDKAGFFNKLFLKSKKKELDERWNELDDLQLHLDLLRNPITFDTDEESYYITVD